MNWGPSEPEHLSINIMAFSHSMTREEFKSDSVQKSISKQRELPYFLKSKIADKHMLRISHVHLAETRLT